MDVPQYLHEYNVVAIALTVYGIETLYRLNFIVLFSIWVAIALTVYGIETSNILFIFYPKFRCNSTYRLRY